MLSHGRPFTSVTRFKGRGLGKNSPQFFERETKMLVQGHKAGKHGSWMFCSRLFPIADLVARIANDLFVPFCLSGLCFASMFLPLLLSLEAMSFFLIFFFLLPTEWFGTNIFYPFTGLVHILA